MMKRVILDVDVGTDDAWAVLLFLQAEKLGLVRIEAITCTSGNTSVDNVCKNLVRLLETVGRTDILVYRGIKDQILKPEHKIKPFHGIDGFADLQHVTDPDLSIIQNKPSCMAINDIVNKYPKQVTLICLAPLTNVALAIRLFDSFATNLKSVYIMGGNLSEAGNVVLLDTKNTLCAEFNFAFDPEAAHIVLNTLECPIYLVPWETCLKCTITTDWRFNVLDKININGMELLTKADKVCQGHGEIWLPCDSYVAMAYLYPESVVSKHSCFATVDLHCRETRGRLILKPTSLNQTPNLTIIEEFDEELVKTAHLKITL